MTPETHAALGRVIAFLDAQDSNVIGSMPVATTREANGTTLELDRADLRTLLDVVDPTPAIEWGVHFKFPQAAAKVPYKSEAQARAALGDAGAHVLIHRYAVRRPDDVSEWIEGEPTTEEGAGQ